MAFIRLTQKQKDALQLEIVPRVARRELTRLIRRACESDELEVTLCRENEFINIANHVLDRPNYTLESDGWGHYEVAEFAWHRGQRELIMRLPTTAQLVEILADYVQKGMLITRDVNSILLEHNCGFSFVESEVGPDGELHIDVEVVPVESIPEVDLTSEHPNVRKLVSRMDRALADKDPAGVLHASACIFETVAKDVVQNPNVENQTLASFFDSYRKKSRLPSPVLDFMLQVYTDRNTVPLAGHGSVSPPRLTHDKAVILAEMTKAIIRIERSLGQQALTRHQLSPPAKVGSLTPPRPKRKK